MLLGSVSHADGDRHRKQSRTQHSAERGHAWHGSALRHQSRHEPRRHEPRRHAPAHRRDAHGYRTNGWRQHDGRYWAPASYRGRYCTDRRHHGGAHYHVAVRDYYDYYYPRYRHHGVLPLISSPSASVIISIPLF
jgi:hypothetical protein